MTPKEKAKEIVEKFLYPRMVANLFCAKKCALICVDEIINELFDGREKATESNNKRIKFYQEVKSEIEKL